MKQSEIPLLVFRLRLQTRSRLRTRHMCWWDVKPEFTRSSLKWFINSRRVLGLKSYNVSVYLSFVGIFKQRLLASAYTPTAAEPSTTTPVAAEIAATFPGSSKNSFIFSSGLAVDVGCITVLDTLLKKADVDIVRDEIKVTTLGVCSMECVLDISMSVVLGSALDMHLLAVLFVKVTSMSTKASGGISSTFMSTHANFSV